MALELSNISELIELAKSGDRRSLSRLMTKVAESENELNLQSDTIRT